MTPSTENNLGGAETIEALWRSGRRSEALALVRAGLDAESLSPELRAVPEVLQTLAEATGPGPDADAAVELATEIRRRIWPKSDPQSAHATQGLIQWYAATGRLEAAEAALAQARAAAEVYLALTPSPLRILLGLSAEVAAQAGRPDDAILFLQRAIEVEKKHRKKGGADELTPLYAELSYHLAQVGRLKEAAAALGEAATGRLAPGEKAEYYARLASLREQLQQYPTAIALVEQAVRLCQKVYGDRHPHTVRHRQTLARLQATYPPK